MKKCDVMVFGAHPDDAEIGAGGIIASLVNAGERVVICDLTAGELSSNGDPARRWQEALASAQELGITERLCLGLPDRGLGDEDQVSELVQVIREYTPRFLLAPWHEDEHPDHRQAAKLVRSAALNARLRRWGSGEAWGVERIWEYFIHQTGTAPLYVRLREEDGWRKQRALACYVSQFVPKDAAVATRLHGLPQRIEWRDRYAGSLVGAAWAEGVWQTEPWALDDLRDLL